MIRATLFFSGRVQGVGFRFHSSQIAKNFSVTGTVENCLDGRVKMVVEADSAEIDRFIDAIQISIPGKIQRIERFESEPSHEFGNFSVRH